MQYLFSNKEDAKEHLYEMDLKFEELKVQQGIVQGLNMILNLCDELDQYKIASEEEKKKIQALKDYGVEPFQAVSEGKTRFNKLMEVAREV